MTRMSDKVIRSFPRRFSCTLIFAIPLAKIPCKPCYITHGNVSAVFLVLGQDVCLFVKKEDVVVTTV